MAKAKSKKDKRENPYLSQAEIEERAEFEKRNFRIKLFLILGIPVALAILYFAFEYFTRLTG